MSLNNWAPHSFARQLIEDGVPVTLEQTESSSIEYECDSRGNVRPMNTERYSARRVHFNSNEDGFSSPSGRMAINRSMTPRATSSGLLRPESQYGSMSPFSAALTPVRGSSVSGCGCGGRRSTQSWR